MLNKNDNEDDEDETDANAKYHKLSSFMTPELIVLLVQQNKEMQTMMMDGTKQSHD
jgi:hypothetical protein